MLKVEIGIDDLYFGALFLGFTENPFEPRASSSGIGHSNSGLGSALKKRFGSIRRKKQDVDA